VKTAAIDDRRIGVILAEMSRPAATVRDVPVEQIPREDSEAVTGEGEEALEQGPMGSTLMTTIEAVAEDAMTAMTAVTRAVTTAEEGAIVRRRG